MNVLRDTWILFIYNMRMRLKTPMWTIVGILQPTMYLLLFAPLLDPLSTVPGFPRGGGLTLFTPAALVLVSLYGPSLAGYTLVAQLRSGEIERLYVTPVSRLALLLGGVLREIVLLLVQATLVVGVAALLGVRISSLAGLGGTLLMLALFGVLLSTAFSAMALRFRDENALAPMMQFLAGPLMLASGLLVPLALAPLWLRTVAMFNPLAYVIDAMRALFSGNLADPVVMRGFAVMIPLTLLSLAWAVRSYRKAVV